MASVGGPIRSLPGTLLRLPEGSMCDEHPDVAAYKRVQGETDSFGYEACDMCQECYETYLKGLENPEPGYCDQCGTHEPLKPFRYVDEGVAGPVHYLCARCRERIRKEEEEDYGY